MASVTHQTIRLGKGKHRSPHEGACVMELASMLAGEAFSDHPASVCPVIGSFLRAYNDSIDDERRQDLYVYASKIVGSRASEDLQRERAERLAAWALALHRRRWTRFIYPGRLRALAYNPDSGSIGSQAVRAIPEQSDAMHAEVLGLIDALLAIGTKERRASVPVGISQPVNESSDPRCLL